MMRLLYHRRLKVSSLGDWRLLASKECKYSLSSAPHAVPGREQNGSVSSRSPFSSGRSSPVQEVPLCMSLPQAFSLPISTMIRQYHSHSNIANHYENPMNDDVSGAGKFYPDGSERFPQLRTAFKSSGSDLKVLDKFLYEDCNKKLQRVSFSCFITDDAKIHSVPTQRMRQFLSLELRYRTAAQLLSLRHICRILSEKDQFLSESGMHLQDFPLVQREMPPESIEELLLHAHHLLTVQYAILLGVTQGHTGPSSSLSCNQSFQQQAGLIRNYHSQVFPLVIAGSRNAFVQQVSEMDRKYGRKNESVSLFQETLDSELGKFLLRNVGIGVLLTHYDKFIMDDHLDRWQSYFETSCPPFSSSSDYEANIHSAQIRTKQKPFLQSRSCVNLAAVGGADLNSNLPFKRCSASNRNPMQDAFSSHTNQGSFSFSVPSNRSYIHMQVESHSKVSSMIPNRRDENFTGIYIDSHCIPVKQVQLGISQVVNMALGKHNYCPPIHIHTIGRHAQDEFIPFNESSSIVFTPVMMQYIILEVLKDAVNATIDRHTMLRNLRKNSNSDSEEFLANQDVIDVCVYHTQKGCWIKVSDSGNGIPDEKMNQIFSFVGNKNPSPIGLAARYLSGLPCKFNPNRSKSNGDKFASPPSETAATLATHQMGGFGVGLNICRAYMTYFGGSITLERPKNRSHGIDTLLYFPSLEGRSETLPVDDMLLNWDRSPKYGESDYKYEPLKLSRTLEESHFAKGRLDEQSTGAIPSDLSRFNPRKHAPAFSYPRQPGSQSMSCDFLFKKW